MSGEVYVRLRGSKRFVRLTGERSIPDGSEVDARNGTVALTVSAGTGGGVRTAVIRWGRFIVDQDAAAEPLTRLILTDALAGCGSAGRKGTRASAAARKNAGKRSRRKRRGAKQRRLWVKEDGGRWQTKGSYASATVEGTEWTTTDLCDRTTVAVTDGTVHVRDIARRRTVTVRRGGSYTARRPDGRRTARR